MELKDLDQETSPHLEERWIGGNVDLDLLSQIPQRYARIMGGIGRGASFPRSTMDVGEGKISCLEELVSFWKKGAFYRSHNKRAVAGKITLETPVC